MGYIRHHAIIVTGSEYSNAVGRAHAKATELGCLASPVDDHATNGFKSFTVFPDGSKEGWDGSREGDERRAALKEFMRNDVSGDLDWVEVYFGGDDSCAHVEDHADVEAASD